MIWTPVKLTKETLASIDNIMSDARYDRVAPEVLEHNYADALSHWLSDEFLLYRGKISVDNYVAFDLTRRGSSGQMLPISMCRKANSNNYDKRRHGSGYMTGVELSAFIEVLNIIEASR